MFTRSLKAGLQRERINRDFCLLLDSLEHAISDRETDNASMRYVAPPIYFRSGWLSRRVSVVRFVNMQTVSMHQSPFDHRKRMASVAVDTAGAGGNGHRIRIPFLDVDIAGSILQRLYAETRSTEFRW